MRIGHAGYLRMLLIQEIPPRRRGPRVRVGLPEELERAEGIEAGAGLPVAEGNRRFDLHWYP